MNANTANTPGQAPDVPPAQELELANYRRLVEACEPQRGVAHVISVEIPQRCTAGAGGGALAIRRAWAALAQALPSPHSATFATEGWVRTMATPTEEAPIGEAAVVVHVSQTSSWAAVQPFVRTRDAVRWQEWEQFPARGAVADELSAIVRDG